tara:strand:- start:19825 stop:20097 length:273 start_codon:yes stop_codon:yes gene_type:complete
MWTQETTKTGHAASFQSDSGVAYVWATQFDFCEPFNTVQHTITLWNRYESIIQTFYEDWDTDFYCTRQAAERLSNPESDIADWAEMAFHF